MAVIGGASAFIESTLAQVYKTKDGKDFRGGPSYYMEKALGKRWMGVLFSVLLIICFAYGFNGLQSYNMSSALEYYIPGYSEISNVEISVLLPQRMQWDIWEALKWEAKSTFHLMRTLQQ